MPRRGAVAVVGSTGFIGSSIRRALESMGIEVRQVRAPRMSCRPGGIRHVRHAVDEAPAVIDDLAEHFRGVGVVVNAAGISDSSTRADAALFGANAVLPAVIREAAVAAGATRFVHVSSAAVQGTGCLDETTAVNPFSPYSRSKALAEEVLAGRSETVIFRPTSVHGADRAVTRALARLARSTWASVSGDGSAPTPQVLVQNVGSAVAFVCQHEGAVPKVVLQPGEALTTGSLLTILGGKAPLEIPAPLARAALASGRLGVKSSPRLLAAFRRLEMLWFGQAQVPGWLTDKGWSQSIGIEGWHELAALASARDKVEAGGAG